MPPPFDPSKPFTLADASGQQYTRQNPLPSPGYTQEQADQFFGLPPGSYVKTPQGPRVVQKKGGRARG